MLTWKKLHFVPQMSNFLHQVLTALLAVMSHFLLTKPFQASGIIHLSFDQSQLGIQAVLTQFESLFAFIETFVYSCAK